MNTEFAWGFLAPHFLTQWKNKWTTANKKIQSKNEAFDLNLSWSKHGFVDPRLVSKVDPSISEQKVDVCHFVYLVRSLQKILESTESTRFSICTNIECS